MLSMYNIQVCNAYTELNDPVVQRERFAEQLKVLFYIELWILKKKMSEMMLW